ncbi:hypothetical protein [Streptomyces sp. NBRC 110035]|uniref:hypothetical protein n=1 Tax=unclassified Streptomyces TaxID=2593676 RepID=UPI0006963A77|nr:hypothetical protein APS67_001775 [Streptomyces sp. AVP053U2]
MRPRVPIPDELAAGLGPDGRERLLATPAGPCERGTTVVMAAHHMDPALRRTDDAAPLTSSGARTGPTAGSPTRTDLLTTAGLRLPWGGAAAHLPCA